jgi:hypothetical protein
MPGIIACYDAQKAASLITSGGRADTWASIYQGYGSNMNLSAIPATNRPFYESTGLNSLPCIRSDPAEVPDPGMVASSTNPLNETDDFTFAFVAQFDTEDEGTLMGFNRIYLVTKTSPFEIGFTAAANTNLFIPSSISVATAFFYVWTYRLSPATLTVALNGEIVYDNISGQPLAAPTNTFKLYDRHASQSATTTLSDAKLGEVIIGNNFLSNSQVDQVSGHLAWNWGLVSLLPAGHPYKNSRPIV